VSPLVPRRDASRIDPRRDDSGRSHARADRQLHRGPPRGTGPAGQSSPPHPHRQRRRREGPRLDRAGQRSRSAPDRGSCLIPLTTGAFGALALESAGMRILATLAFTLALATGSVYANVQFINDDFETGMADARSKKLPLLVYFH